MISLPPINSDAYGEARAKALRLADLVERELSPTIDALDVEIHASGNTHRGDLLFVALLSLAQARDAMRRKRERLEGQA